MTPAARATARRDLLAQAGWDRAAERPLAGDASARSYARLTLGDATAVLMDAPPGGGEEIAPFLRIAGHLAALGLSPPRAIAADAAAGYLLMEDLGDLLLARLAGADPATAATAYGVAVDVLVHLQRAPVPPGLPDLSAQDWAGAAGLAVTAYARAPAAAADDLTRPLAAALCAHADGPRVLILRDYHAENLLWLPGRAGLARIGLLDFQLAQGGQPAYDLVSLIQDARRDVPADLAAALAARFRRATGAPGAEFAAALAVLGAQRALRILGVFARLAAAGKPQYLPLLPRVWGQLQANLAHPALAGVAAAVGRRLPAPTPDHLARLRTA